MDYDVVAVSYGVINGSGNGVCGCRINDEFHVAKLFGTHWDYMSVNIEAMRQALYRLESKIVYPSIVLYHPYDWLVRVMNEQTSVRRDIELRDKVESLKALKAICNASVLWTPVSEVEKCGLLSKMEEAMKT